MTFFGALDRLDFGECFEWISENKFKRVALQIPDSMLEKSGDIYMAFTEYFDDGLVEFSICADSTNNSCCLDFTNTNHYYIDAIVHFGTACLSPCSKVDNFYFINILKDNIKDQDLNEQFDLILKRLHAQKESNPILIAYDLEYSYLASKFEKFLSELNFNADMMQLLPSIKSNVPQKCNAIANSIGSIFCNRLFPKQLSQYSENEILFFGSKESELLLNLTLALVDQNISVINQNSDGKIALQCTKNSQDDMFHMRFGALAQKMQKASVIGILVTPFVYDQYPTAAGRAKQLLKNLNKQHYELTVNRLDDAKLATFPEIEIFVYLACPFALSRVKPKQFYKEIVNLGVLEYALNPNFKGDLTDLTHDIGMFELGRKLYCDLPENKEKDQNELGGEIVLKSFYENLPINKREWKGLEPNLGVNAPSKLKEGLKGVASGYEKELQEIHP